MEISHISLREKKSSERAQKLCSLPVLLAVLRTYTGSIFAFWIYTNNLILMVRTYAYLERFSLHLHAAHHQTSHWVCHLYKNASLEILEKLKIHVWIFFCKGTVVLAQISLGWIFCLVFLCSRQDSCCEIKMKRCRKRYLNVQPCCSAQCEMGDNKLPIWSVLSHIFCLCCLRWVKRQTETNGDERKTWIIWLSYVLKKNRG